MNSSIDIRVVGQMSELKEFVNLCKVIQHLGRMGSNRTIKLTVDGDGSGRLAFYGIERKPHVPSGVEYIDFNSNGIDVDSEEALDLYIGE